MIQNARKYLSALALLEWGAILLYFYISGRLAVFLHPSFHSMVLTSGILLVIGAVCNLVIDRRGPEHDCGREHDQSLSFKTAVTFFILFVPLAVAALVSPNSFSAAKMRNTGFVENARSLPGAADHAKRIAESTANVAQPRSQSAPMYAGVDSPKNAADQPQGFTPDIQGENGKVYSKPLQAKDDTPVANNVVPVDSSADNSAQAGSQAPPDDNSQFKPDKDGFYGVTVVDLLFGSEDAQIRKNLLGKPLKMLGQYMPPTASDAKVPHFDLMRVFMFCCAADARPVKVAVETKSLRKPFHAPAEMGWLNITGTVRYQKTGDKLTPVFIARSITKAPAPEDPFAY